MFDRVKDRLSYANVVATLALFIALGGSSYAAIRISGSQIEDASVSGKKLKRNTVTGVRIKEAGLGRVPRAKNADRLGGRSLRQLRLRCPAGTRLSSDVCVELSPRAAQPHAGAKGACEVAGRRLPTYEELAGVIDDQDVGLPAGPELTGQVYPSASRPGFVEVLTLTGDTGTVAVAQSNEPRAFRCASDPAN